MILYEEWGWSGLDVRRLGGKGGMGYEVKYLRSLGLGSMG